MEFKRSQRLCLVGAGIGAALLAFGGVQYMQTRMLLFWPICLVFVPLICFALFAYVRLILAEKQAEEKKHLELERRELSHESELFDGLEDALRVVKKTRDQFLHIMVPILSVLLGGLLVGGAWFWLQKLSGFTAEDIKPNLEALGRMGTLSLIIAVLVLVAGGYFVGASQSRGNRWLRSIGSWFFLGCAFLGFGALAQFSFSPERIWLHLLITRILWGILGLLGIEMILGVIIEFYRPRVPGEEERPVYESRFLNLFTESGGVAKNIAASLDYQFGFKVSDAWFYRLMVRTILPTSLFLCVTMWSLTSIIQINVGEEGLKESFGVIQKEVLQPGLYVKWPYPFERIIKYPTHKLDKIHVGSSGYNKSSEYVLWTESHLENERYFVTAGDLDSLTLTRQDGRKWSVSAYLMSASIPVYFRVKDLYKFYVCHSNPRQLLSILAYRIVAEHMGQCDFNSLLTRERMAIAEGITTDLQKIADEFDLGVSVEFIGFSELHPPVEVGKDFNQVVSAGVMYDNALLQAEIYAAQQLPGAEAEAVETVNRATIYRDECLQREKGKMLSYNGMLQWYRKVPLYFKYDRYLSVLEDDFKGVRSYLMAVPGKRKTYIFDQTDKVTSGLTEVDFNNMRYGESVE